MVSREGSGSPVSRQPAHLQTQAEYGAYLGDSSRVPRRRPFIYLNRRTPSGQTRVYRVTQLRTDGVYCREFAGTGPVVLKVVCVYLCVCVCVLSSHLFWTSGLWTHHPGSHRISPPSFCRCLTQFFSRFSRSFPSSTVKSNFVYYRFNHYPLAGQFYFIFL